MPSRIRLTWNRNQDAETQSYRVFRDEDPNIDHKLSLDRIVMKVDQPKGVNPITIMNEQLRRESEYTFAIGHKNIILELNGTPYPFTVMVDDEQRSDFTLDTGEGKVVFDEIVPSGSIVVIPEYTFDGVQVWDYEIEEEGKAYYGPEAKDTSPPTTPENVMIEKDTDRNRLIMRWDAVSPIGKVFYYRVDAAIDNQRFSKLSLLRNAFIQEPLADRPYLIERSDDGKRWVEIARQKTNVFYEYMIDRQAPNGVTGMTVSAYIYANQGKAQVTVNWDRVRDDTVSRTSMYRVRAQNRVGILSDPSAAVGPIPFKVELDYILIRRKIYDGSSPSFDGIDAETVAKYTDLSKTQFIEDLEDNTQYVYGIWVVDRAGNYSAIASSTIYITDATPPTMPLNLSATEFQVVI